MPLSNAEQRLLRLSKLPAAELAFLKEGVSFEADFSRTLDELVAQASADRLELAAQFIKMADALRRSRTDLARAAIARYYYAMYHAMRAVSFYFHAGDDFEKHSDLFQKGIPADYPNRIAVRNVLKDARERRNEADYDPYPASPTHFKVIQRSIAPEATAFVADARAYVKAKGNPYL